MEAKDAVMGWDEIVKLTGFVSDVDSHPAKRMRELAKKQAEISFKEGERKVVEWVESHRFKDAKYYYQFEKSEWQAFKKSRRL